MYKTQFKIALVGLSIIIFNTLFAQRDLYKLSVGDTAPNFIITNHEGVKINLYEKLDSNKIVLVFYRGEWCPYCNMHMSHLQDSINLILAKGASVIALTPEQNKSIEKTVLKTKATFDICFDSAYVVMNKYGTAFKLNDITYKKYRLVGIDIEDSNGNKDHILTVPATFVINRNRIIEYVHFDENYKKRSTVFEILKHL